MSIGAIHRRPRRVVSPEYALLGLLMLGPNHGYDLHLRLTTDLGYVWHVSQSQAYAILRRLEQRGDVAARAEGTTRPPRRQVLHITASGRRRFHEWLQGTATSGARTVRLEFLTRLYFANLLLPGSAGQIQAAQEREVAGSIQRLRLLLSQVPLSQGFNRMSLDLRLRQMELVHLWLQEIRMQSETR